MLQSPTATVRIADVTLDVIPTIAALADSCALESTAALNQGFLVAGYDAQDYRRFCGEAVDFIVAEDSDLGVCGFALTRAEDQGIHIDQVAVSPLSKRRGIGRLLYEELLRRHPGGRISAHIVGEPMNVASIAFHEALGFVFESQLPGPGFLVGRWIRDDSPETGFHDRNVTS